MNKHYKLIVFVALLALVLSVACAPSAAQPTSAPPTQAPSTAPTAAAPTQAANTAPTQAAATAPAAASKGPAGVLRLPLRPGVTVGSLWTAAGRHLDEAFLSGLAEVKWTADGVQPMLAKSWDMEDGGKAFVFHLRDDVKWSDGKPFTADDVLYTFNTYANPKVGAIHAGKLSDIVGYADVKDGKTETLSGVTKVDDHTVRVELSTPSPLFVELKIPFVSILPAHILSSVPADKLKGNDYWNNVVGTGPFVMTKMIQDQLVEGVANPDYFEGKPKLDKVVYQVYADSNTMLAALEAGEIDGMLYQGGGIPVDQVARFKALPNLTVLGDMDAGLPTFMLINLNKDYFKDVRVRQAIMHAIDRQTIIDTVKLGTGTLSNTMFPMEWARAKDLTDYPYDPEKAKALLKEAGWDSSRQIDLQRYYTDQVNKDTVDAIAAQLQAVGINAVVREVKSAEFQASIDDNSLELAYAANGQGLDPSLGFLVTGCKQRLSVGYCNEEVDKLYTEGQSSADRAVRAPSYQKISKILNEELPKGWLWWEVRPVAFDNRIVGLAEHFSEQPLLLFDIPVYNQMHTWYTK